MFNTFPRPKKDSDSNIKSIQRGEYTFLTTDVSAVIPISPVDTTKSIVRISWYELYITNNRQYYSVVLTNSTSITIAHGSAGSAGTISWEVIEFNNVKSIQSGTVNLAADGEYTQNISPVNPLNSLVYATFSTNSVSQNPASLKNRFIDSTKLGFKCNNAAVTATVKWQLIEFY